MTTKPRLLGLALAAVLALALLVTPPALRPSAAHERDNDKHVSAKSHPHHTQADSEQAPAEEQLVGTWRLTQLETGTEGNLVPSESSGEIAFSAAGTASVQAMNPDPQAPDTAYTTRGYEAYYGSYTTQDGTFTLTVQSSLVRDLIGQELTRSYEVDGDTLVLTPQDPSEGWRVIYERA